MNNGSPKIAIIGAGAAGMFAAALLGDADMDVTVFERNSNDGRKLAITGKGRCNLTNNCTPEEYLENVPTNPRFMRGAINRFTPQDTMDFFESAGVPLKTERGNRVFPESDSAYDIVDALKKRMGRQPIRERVESIYGENGRITGLSAGGRKYDFDIVLLCTGGKSYPKTGSTGDGYKFAASLGHNIVEPEPSLVPLVCDKKICAPMQGLSLRNVELTLLEIGGKRVFSEFGELLFTHFGMSGPLVLSASAHMKRGKKYRFEIDLKPALDRETIDKRVQSDFRKYINKDFANSLSDLLPKSMIPVAVAVSGITGSKKVNAVTKEERRRFVDLLKAFPIEIYGFRPIDEAIITSGGVDVSQIDPKTMESRLVKGLYFAGEVIDVDCYTGGFNLQTAFSTAYSAARAIINKLGVRS